MNWLQQLLSKKKTSEKLSNSKSAAAAAAAQSADANQSKTAMTSSQQYLEEDNVPPLHLHAGLKNPRLIGYNASRSRSLSPKKTEKIALDNNSSTSSIVTMPTDIDQSSDGGSTPRNSFHLRTCTKHQAQNDSKTDFLLDKIGLEGEATLKKNREAFHRKMVGGGGSYHQQNTSTTLKAVVERLADNELEDSAAFADIKPRPDSSIKHHSHHHSRSSSGSLLTPVCERLGEDQLDDSAAFADVVVVRKSSSKNKSNDSSSSSLKPVCEKFIDDEDSAGFKDVQPPLQKGSRSSSQLNIKSMSKITEQMDEEEDEEEEDDEDEDETDKLNE